VIASTFEPAKLDALTGTYVDEFNLGEVIVTRVGDALNLDIPQFNDNGVPYEHGMTRVTTRVWIATVGGNPFEISFIDGPNGETYLRNRDAVAVRAPAVIRAAAKSPIRRLDRSPMLRWLEAVVGDETPALLRATGDLRPASADQ
jgi:hypothetical protein